MSQTSKATQLQSQLLGLEKGPQGGRVALSWDKHPCWNKHNTAQHRHEMEKWHGLEGDQDHQRTLKPLTHFPKGLEEWTVHEN